MRLLEQGWGVQQPTPSTYTHTLTGRFRTNNAKKAVHCYRFLHAPTLWIAAHSFKTMLLFILFNIACYSKVLQYIWVLISVLFQRRRTGELLVCPPVRSRLHPRIDVSAQNQVGNRPCSNDDNSTHRCSPAGLSGKEGGSIKRVLKVVFTLGTDIPFSSICDPSHSWR